MTSILNALEVGELRLDRLDSFQTMVEKRFSDLPQRDYCYNCGLEITNYLYLIGDLTFQRLCKECAHDLQKECRKFFYQSNLLLPMLSWYAKILRRDIKVKRFNLDTLNSKEAQYREYLSEPEHLRSPNKLLLTCAYEGCNTSEVYGAINKENPKLKIKSIPILVEDDKFEFIDILLCIDHLNPVFQIEWVFFNDFEDMKNIPENYKITFADLFGTSKNITWAIDHIKSVIKDKWLKKLKAMP